MNKPNVTLSAANVRYLKLIFIGVFRRLKKHIFCVFRPLKFPNIKHIWNLNILIRKMMWAYMVEYDEDAYWPNMVSLFLGTIAAYWDL